MKKQDLIQLIKECHGEILKEARSRTFENFESLIDDYGLSAEKLVLMMTDFFNSNQLAEFYNHCAEEMGLETDDDQIEDE